MEIRLVVEVSLHAPGFVEDLLPLGHGIEPHLKVGQLQIAVLGVASRGGRYSLLHRVNRHAVTFRDGFFDGEERTVRREGDVTYSSLLMPKCECIQFLARRHLP